MKIYKIDISIFKVLKYKDIKDNLKYNNRKFYFKNIELKTLNRKCQIYIMFFHMR